MISKLSIKKPVTTLMLVLAVVILGIVSMGRLNLALMPNLDFPYALAFVSYTGAGPEEMENLITRPLEGTLGTTTNLKNMTSQSTNGMSIVFLEFEEGTDIDTATLNMREKIDMIKSVFPEDASSPTVMQMDMNMMPILMFSITGSGKYDVVELNRIVEDRIQSRIERIGGVASVSISGGKTEEITVNIIPDKIKGYGVTSSQITQLLSAENLNLPVGTIKQGDMDLTVRSVGEFQTVEEIRNLPITTSTGSTILLSDVADINRTYKEQTSESYVNGERALSISVSKQSTANTVNVARAVNAEIEEIKREMPDLRIITVMDQSVFVQGTIDAVLESALYGAALAVIILYIFLRNVRSTLIVGTSIPISIVATLMIMYFSGLTMNMVSLGGLALGIGMLVDNSIVVLENIFRHREMGKSRKKAAADGAVEISMAVTASTLTTIAVFLPIVYVQGMAAQIFKELALTVSFSLFVSLVVALTWVPMASSIILKIEVYRPGQEKKITRRLLMAWGNVLNKLDIAYQKLLGAAIKHTIITTLITIAFFIGTLALVPTVGMEFFGNMDQGGIDISVTMPKGTLLQETAEATYEIVDLIEETPEIQDLFMSIGGGSGFIGSNSSDTSSITLQLVPLDQRSRSVDEVIEEVRAKLVDIPGAEISVSAASSGMGGMGGSGLDLTIYGDDLDGLEQVANDVRDIVAEVQGTREVKTSLDVGSPEAAIRINRSKASVYGVSASTVARTLNTAVSGSVATKFKVDSSEIDVRVRQDPTNINYITDIENIIVQTPMGAGIPLYEIADIETQNAPVTIVRENQARTLSVTASIYGRDTNSAAQEVTQKLAEYEFPSGYYYEFSGSQQQMMESFQSLGMALMLSVVLVYMVMASQFESLMYPFIILMSVPIALTAGILGLIVMGIPLSIVGFIGLIMLVGIVVNNGIVLVDYINQLRGEGKEMRAAILEACPTRLRPILMTTLTTVLALVPMLVSAGDGSEMQKPLATVVVFGLTISTLVTLVYIPVLYMHMNSVRNFFKKLFRIKDTSDSSENNMPQLNEEAIEIAENEEVSEVTEISEIGESSEIPDIPEAANAAEGDENTENDENTNNAENAENAESPEVSDEDKKEENLEQ